MGRLLAIVNAGAGTTDTESIEAALAVLREQHTVEVVHTSSAGELDDVLADPDCETLVVFGGDGSLHAVVAALYRSGRLPDVPIALIPLGTGNDFARTMGVAESPTDAARQFLGAQLNDLDLIVDDRDGIVVNAVHIGLGAEAGRQAENWKQRLGKPGYLIGALKAGFATRGLSAHVEIDSVPVHRSRGSNKIAQVAIGNGRFVGGGTELVPDAKPDNDELEVLVSFANAPFARLVYALHLRRGTHEQRHDVVTQRAQDVAVMGEGFWCNADGELSGPCDSIRWEIRPAAWRMYVPSQPVAADGLSPGLEA